MAFKRYAVTVTRQITESVTLNIDAQNKTDAAMKAGAATKDASDEDWTREVGDARVASVEIARAEAAQTEDPMTIPPLLKREAVG